MMNRLAAVMVVMVMGLTAFGAKAAQPADNLSLEVRVTIAGTTDVQWVNTAGVTLAALNDNAASGDNVNTDKNTLGVADAARWTIQNPDFGQTRATDTSSASLPAADKTADEAVELYLDNVGKRAVTITAVVSSEDTATGGWTVRATPGVSQYSLAIKVSDATTGGLDTAGGATNVAVTGLGSPGNFVELGGASAPVAAVTLATAYSRRMNHIKVDLQYKTPTEVSADSQLDIDHAAVITIVATAN